MDILNSLFQFLDENTWIVWLCVVNLAFRLGIAWQRWQFAIALQHHPERIQATLDFIKKLNSLKDEEQLELLDNVDKEGTESVFKPQSNKTEMSIERVNNMLFAYAKDTNQFLAQGASVDEIVKTLQVRFPDRSFFGDLPKDNSTN